LTEFAFVEVSQPVSPAVSDYRIVVSAEFVGSHADTGAVSSSLAGRGDVPDFVARFVNSVKKRPKFSLRNAVRRVDSELFSALPVRHDVLDIVAAEVAEFLHRLLGPNVDVVLGFADFRDSGDWRLAVIVVHH